VFWRMAFLMTTGLLQQARVDAFPAQDGDQQGIHHWIPAREQERPFPEPLHHLGRNGKLPCRARRGGRGGSGGGGGRAGGLRTSECRTLAAAECRTLAAAMVPEGGHAASIRVSYPSVESWSSSWRMRYGFSLLIEDALEVSSAKLSGVHLKE